MTRVLVAYGSKRGGTAGLASMLAKALAARGVEAEAHDARAVESTAGFDAVVVAGALYSNRWHRDARRFVRRHAAELRALPVWLVSTGPLDDSASEGTLATVRQVSELADRVGARGTQTFGGRLAADAKGFPASAMARTKAGDWRDPEQVDRFAADVSQALAADDAP